MSEFNSKNKHNFWHSPLILIVLFCILILFAYNIIGLFEKERETSRKKEFELSKIENLRKREESLIKDINKLETEDGVEETIREKYPVVKDGEKMVTIVDQEPESYVASEDIVSEHNFWSWIKRTFGLN